jgi:capsular exopolysaccharide synthesis family protein
VNNARREEGERRRASEEQTFETFEDVPGSLVTVLDPTSATAEAYHILGTNLHYALADTASKVIVLTSPGSGEGKTTVCANLGVVLAEANRRVLVVDCHLHRPNVHKVFGLRNLQGLENVLSGERMLQEVQQESLAGLWVVTAGPAPPYPAELLGSRRFKEFLHEVSSEFDYVLIDSPPMSTVPDSLVLSTQGDGILLVVDAQTTRKEALRHTIRSLETVRANVLGTVMSNVKAGK